MSGQLQAGANSPASAMLIVADVMNHVLNKILKVQFY